MRLSIHKGYIVAKNVSYDRLEARMAPPSESTKLESSGRLVEYVGSGKLKDKKALITGGEYVQGQFGQMYGMSLIV